MMKFYLKILNTIHLMRLDASKLQVLLLKDFKANSNNNQMKAKVFFLISLFFY